MFLFLLKPKTISSVVSEPLITDEFAPHYFIQSDQAVQAFQNTKPINILDSAIVRFSPQKPWTLYLLIEKSRWIDSLQQDSAILFLLEKLEPPPEKIISYSFNTGIEKLDMNWERPTLLSESTEEEVHLFDSIQRLNQIIQQNNYNSLLCFIGSGNNTSSFINFPLVYCPIWVILPDKKKTSAISYLSALSVFSKGELYTFQELEEIAQLHLPSQFETSILHFRIPYQWSNFSRKIRIYVNNRDTLRNTLFILNYPVPWLSLFGLVFLFMAIFFILSKILQRRKKHLKEAESKKFYSLAWLEWTDRNTGKQSKRIHSCDFTIGSNPNCHLSVQDDSVSDYHALIQEKELHFTISDLSSRYGVMINNAKVAIQSLKDGDQIQIGNIYLTFRQSHIKYESNEKYL